MIPLLDVNEERVARKFSDPRTMIGISDGGAHVDMLLQRRLSDLSHRQFRARQAITLEHAIKRITAEPARFFGMADRGELRPGLAADITIFDFDRIGSPERPEVRYDFPGGKNMPAGDAGRKESSTRSSTAKSSTKMDGIQERCQGGSCVQDRP